MATPKQVRYLQQWAEFPKRSVPTRKLRIIGAGILARTVRSGLFHPFWTDRRTGTFQVHRASIHVLTTRGNVISTPAAELKGTPTVPGNPTESRLTREGASGTGTFSRPHPGSPANPR